MLIAQRCSALLTGTNYFLDGIAGFAPAETELGKPGKQTSRQLGNPAVQQPIGQACGKLRSLSGCRSVSRQLAGKVASQNPRNQERLAMYLLTWLLSVTLMNQHALTEHFSSLASALNNKQNTLEKKKKNATHNLPGFLNPLKENQLKLKVMFLAHVALWKITESRLGRNPQQESGGV